MAEVAAQEDTRPVVAVLVSGSSKASRDSANIGCYLAGCLGLGGHVRVCMVSLPGELTRKSLGDPPYNPLPFSIVCNGGWGKENLLPIDESVVECYAPSERLRKAAVVLVCVDSEDTSRAAAFIKNFGLPSRKDHLGIVSLQKGVKNSSQLSDCFAKDKDVTVLEGAVGLDVVASPVDRSMGSLSLVGALVVERIKREKAKNGTQIADLLETSGIPVIYRRNLTTFTWGIVIFYGCMAAVNALTGASVTEDLQSTEARLVMAAIVRECLAVMRRAAKDGKWSPDTEACSRITLPQLEYLLCLPTFLFGLLSPLLLPIRAGVPSSMQMDLYHRLETSVASTLGEVQSVGKGFKIRTPVLDAVLERIRKAARKGEGVQAVSPETLFVEVGKPRASAKEAMIFLIKVLTVLVVIAALLFLWLL